MKYLPPIFSKTILIFAVFILFTAFDMPTRFYVMLETGLTQAQIESITGESLGTIYIASDTDEVYSIKNDGTTKNISSALSNNEELGGSTRLSNNTTAINFGSSTSWTNRNLNNTTFNELPNSLLISGGFATVTLPGTYTICISGNVTSAGIRATTAFGVRVGGGIYPIDGTTIRNSSSINDMSFAGCDILQLSSGDEIRLISRREGTVTDSVTPVSVDYIRMTITRNK